MLKKGIIALLNNNVNTILSGEVIAKELGVSRVTISKNIKALKEEGYLIDIIANKGYILENKIDVLSQKVMCELITTPLDIHVFDLIDSTNTYAKNHLCDNSKLSLVVSDEQSAGRGRFNKKFYSPKGTGIYMSLVVPINKPFESIKHLTCAVSVVVAKTLEELGSEEVGIKWVNDLFLGDKKICGILTEATTDLETHNVQNVVIGIGINTTTIEFPTDVNATAINIDVTRNEIISGIVNKFLALDNYEVCMREYQKRSILDGKNIDFIHQNKEQSGVVKCINSDGNLVVEVEGAEVTLYSGEVSIGSNQL